MPLRAGSGERTHLVQEMCLAPADFVSDRIVAKGAWRDCGMYVRLWQGLDGKSVSRHEMVPLPAPGDPQGVLLEVGANIGACTVELLLRTNASIVAPSAALTRCPPRPRSFRAP